MSEFVIRASTGAVVSLPSGTRGPAGRLYPCGEYSAATVYNVDDLVTYGGSSYVKTVFSAAAILPTNETYWQLIAQGYDITVSDTPPSNPTENSLWVDVSV